MFSPIAPSGVARYVYRMYVRRTQTRRTATGETYFTHRLVRSERQGRKVRAVTVLNLGRHSRSRRSTGRRCVLGSPPPSEGPMAVLHVRKATRAEHKALAIYQALNLNPVPGGIVKMIM